MIEDLLVKSVQAGKKEAAGPPPAEPGYKWVRKPWGWVKVPVSQPKPKPPEAKAEARPAVEASRPRRPRTRPRRRRPRHHRPSRRTVKRVLEKQERIEEKEREIAELRKAEEEAEQKAVQALAEALEQVQAKGVAGAAEQLAEAVKEAVKSLTEQLKEKAEKVEEKITLASVQAERESIPAEAKILKAYGLARKAVQEAAEARKVVEELKPEAEELSKQAAELSKKAWELTVLRGKLEEKIRAAERGELSPEEYEKLKQEVEAYNVKLQRLEEEKKRFEQRLEKYGEKAAAVQKQVERARAIHGSARHMLESAVKELREAQRRYAKTVGELTVEAIGIGVEAQRLSKALKKAVEAEVKKRAKPIAAKGMPEALAESLRLAPAAGTLYEIAGMTGAPPGVVLLGPGGTMEYAVLGKGEGEVTATGLRPPEEYERQALKRAAHVIPEAFSRLVAEVVLNPERVATALKAAVKAQALGPAGLVQPFIERYVETYKAKKAELLSKGVPPSAAEKLASTYAMAELGETASTAVSFTTALLGSILKAKALYEALKPPELREYAIVPEKFEARLVRPGPKEYELVKLPGEDVWVAQRTPEALAHIKVTGRAELIRAQPLKPGTIIGAREVVTPTGRAALVTVVGPEGEELTVPVVGPGRPGTYAFLVQGGPGKAGLAVQEVPGGRVAAVTVQRIGSLTGARVPWSAEIVVHGRGAPATELVEEFMTKAGKVIQHARLQQLPLGGKAVQQLLGEPLVREAVGPIGGTMKVIVFPEPGKLAEAVPGAELLGVTPITIMTPKLKPGMVVGPEAGLIQVEPGKYVQSLTELLQLRKAIEERVGELLKQLEALAQPVELPELFKVLPGRLRLKPMPKLEELTVPELRVPGRLEVPAFKKPAKVVPEAPELVPPGFKPPEVKPTPVVVPKVTPKPVEIPSVEAPPVEVPEVKEEEEELEVPEVPPVEVPPPPETVTAPTPIEVPAPPPPVDTTVTPPAVPPSPPEEELKAPRAPPPLLPWWRRWWLAYLRYLRRLRRMRQAEALTL